MQKEVNWPCENPLLEYKTEEKYEEKIKETDAVLKWENKSSRGYITLKHRHAKKKVARSGAKVL